VTSSSIDLGFCWTLPGATPEEGLPKLREAGFDGVEIWPDYLTRFGLDRWAAALDASGMRCLQLCPYFNFVHGPEAIEASRQLLREAIEAARALSCSRLRVFTGPAWGEGTVSAREATGAQWRAAIDGLQEFCDAAPDVEFCLECHEGSLMEDSTSTLRLLEEVGRSNLTVNLQLPLLNEDWKTSLERLAERTTHIHIHNWTEGLGEGVLTFLEEGAFDWLPVVREMVRRDRSVCLSVEHADHHGRHDPWETARRDGPFLQKLRQLSAE
jgi:sugar phosphate isomerase/epimerase